MGPWIVCKKDKKNCILARDDCAYYIVEVGRGLDLATAQWLESQGVSELLLKELQLPFEYIPRKVLQSVAFSGYKSGEMLNLHLKKGIRSLELCQDLEKAFCREFFPGIPRSNAPATKKKKPENWRQERRDAALYRKLKPVPGILLAWNVIAGIGIFITNGPFWLTLLLLGILIPVLLDIFMPAYFTLFFEEKGKKRDALGLDMVVLLGLLAPIFADSSTWLGDMNFWAVVGICGLASVLICLLAEEFRRRMVGLLAVLFFGGIFGIGAVGAVNEVYDRTEPQVYQLEVLDTHKSGGRSTTYYCTVELPGFGEENLKIPRKLYEELEAGDLVRVEVGQGALGIPYATAEPYGEGL